MFGIIFALQYNKTSHYEYRPDKVSQVEVMSAFTSQFKFYQITNDKMNQNKFLPKNNTAWILVGYKQNKCSSNNI